jgi:methyltransferase
MSPIAVAVTLVAAQRIAELAWSQHNLRALRLSGAVEHGRAHYPLIVALHAAWLAALVLFVSPETWPDPALVALYAALQLVRLWAIVSLGRYWTTRVVTVPGAPLTRRGPYRWLRHPIYAVVVAEIALLPLAFGAWRIALAFSLANLMLLARRIHVEARAIAPRRAITP